MESLIDGFKTIEEVEKALESMPDTKEKSFFKVDIEEAKKWPPFEQESVDRFNRYFKENPELFI